MIRPAVGSRCPPHWHCADRGLPLPAALVLLSPWVDLAMRDAPAAEPPGEAMLSVAWARACATHYLGNTTSADAPLVSPLFADLRGLPTTLIQAGTDELLHDQALQLEGALQAAGVEAHCEITAGRWHVFQTHGGVLRSADEALERIGPFRDACTCHGSRTRGPAVPHTMKS